MAVLFPTTQGQFLRPDRPAELLQGFLNIESLESVQTGKLSLANLQDFAQKRFIVADPNNNVANYLGSNFAAIAALDGDNSSISVNDLVQLRTGLPSVNTTTPVPAPAPVPTPTPTPTPSTGDTSTYPSTSNPYGSASLSALPQMLYMMLQFMQLMLSSLAQRR
jgi:hypothetical protein